MQYSQAPKPCLALHCQIMNLLKGSAHLASSTEQWDSLTEQPTFGPEFLAPPATLNPALVSPVASTSGLTYYVRFTPAGTAAAPLDGTTLYQINHSSFTDTAPVSVNGTVSAPGPVVFDSVGRITTGAGSAGH